MLKPGMRPTMGVYCTCIIIVIFFLLLEDESAADYDLHEIKYESCSPTICMLWSQVSLPNDIATRKDQHPVQLQTENHRF